MVALSVAFVDAWASAGDDEGRAVLLVEAVLVALAMAASLALIAGARLGVDAGRGRASAVQFTVAYALSTTLIAWWTASPAISLGLIAVCLGVVHGRRTRH